MQKREGLSSRLGFILLSAGCAIGLGNVWRFPVIAGRYGGALFVLIYIVFLVVLGLPIMTCEFAVGRASRRSIARSFNELEPKGSRWHSYRWIGIGGNYLLMMFYTTISGWIFYYFLYMLRGDFAGEAGAAAGAVFEAHIGDPVKSVVGMAIVTAAGFGICALGLQNGVERITKWMMGALVLVLVALVGRSVTLPGAGEGLRFFLMPSLDAVRQYGWWEVIWAAMGQAFFTLSLGIGCMAIFGSYIGKERRLAGEALNVTILDTAIAMMAGLVIFPACAAFGVDPGTGPGLVFVTLPQIFAEMPGSRVWGSLFFLFMLFAALSTLIAVFENIIACTTDLTGCSRRKAAAGNLMAVLLLSLPCALGFNLLAGFQPLGAGSTVLDLEDLIVSNNILPLGALVYLLFCTSRRGWGWKAFLAEANTGKGMGLSPRLRGYMSFVLPVVVLVVFVLGYVELFGN